ncbi:hypothetical protein ACRRTK_018382 [Alexandromys fortis]
MSGPRATAVESHRQILSPELRGQQTSRWDSGGRADGVCEGCNCGKGSKDGLRGAAEGKRDFESNIVTLWASEDGLICFTLSPLGVQLYPSKNKQTFFFKSTQSIYSPPLQIPPPLSQLEEEFNFRSLLASHECPSVAALKLRSSRT